MNNSQQIVTIPYTPRDHWAGPNGLHAMLGQKRFSVIVAHRRFGKTYGVINQLLRKMITHPRDDCRFGYVAPFRSQAKEIAWAYLKRFMEPIPNCKISETDLSIEMAGKGKIRLYGADNENALRGVYFDGLVIDEVADMSPTIWGEVLRPTLADRKGWCIFIGTPRGQNVFHELYTDGLRMVNNQWQSFMYRADETGVIDPDELEQLRQELSDSKFRQEFLCDFTASVDDNLISLESIIQAEKRVLDDSDWNKEDLIIGDRKSVV